MAAPSSAPAMPEPGMKVVPLSAEIGAEIRGIDLARLADDAAFAPIHAAWLAHQVLLFRGQDLSDADLIAFSRRFGALDLAPIPGHGRAFVAGHPEMFVISNVKESGRAIGSLGDGECLWHTDMAYTERPPKASCLYAIEVPDGEGDTGFLNMYTAYATLPAGLRARIDGRTIKHDSKYTLDGLPRDETGETLALARARGTFDVRSLPGLSHPAIRTHPETGRKALYLGRRQNTYVDGLEVGESEALLDALWAHAEALGSRAWHNRWRAGDLVIWDNRCVMHRRNAFPPTARRVMHRTQVRAEARPA